jgi:hypothetical protein
MLVTFLKKKSKSFKAKISKLTISEPPEREAKNLQKSKQEMLVTFLKKKMQKF